MKNDVTIAGLIREETRTEFRKMLRSMLNALDGDTATTAGSAKLDKPKRTRRSKPKTDRHAMRDANGTVWSGRGRKPTGFDDSTAVSMVALAV